MTLFQKAPHILVAGYRELKVEFTWKLLLISLAFIEQEDAIQATGGEKLAVDLLRSGSCIIPSISGSMCPRYSSAMTVMRTTAF